MTRLLRITTIIAASAFAFSATAQQAKPAPSSVNRAEIEAIIKDYLNKNPEVVVDSLNAYQGKKMEEAQTKAKDIIKNRSKDITEGAMSPTAGAKNADVVVVEFFDYHCGYCKNMVPVITQLLSEDKKVKVVFRELPILSEDSEVASRAAIALYKLVPDKYFAYHTSLMKAQGKFEAESLIAEAKKLGANETKMRELMKSKEVDEELKKNRELAVEIGIAGTPALIVGTELFPGAVNIEDLKNIIAKTRGGSEPSPKPVQPAPNS